MMRFQKQINILGVRVCPLKIAEINSIILEIAAKPFTKPVIIFKPYVEFLVAAAKNKDINDLLNKADIILADGVSLQWAASYLYGKPRLSSNILSLLWSLLIRFQNKNWRTQVIPQVVAGIDMTYPLLQHASKAKLRIGILGGPRNSDNTKQQLLRIFPGIQLTVINGYFSTSEESSIVQDIAYRKFDILFVALGFPKQEKFIIRHKDQLRAKVIIGEGGSFDYRELGGKIGRAPKIIRRIGLEWLWRLIRQPQRITRQVGIFSFVLQVYKAKKQLV